MFDDLFWPKYSPELLPFGTYDSALYEEKDVSDIPPDVAEVDEDDEDTP